MLSKELLTQEQQRAISRLYEADRTMFIGGLGFGKCIVGLTAATELINDGVLSRVLVIAPLRVITSTWLTEIRKWDYLDPSMMISAVGGAQWRKRALESKAQIVCVNFESAKQLIQEAKALGIEFDGLLIDELTCLKACGGELVKVLRFWVKKLKWRVGMTATPVAECAEDIYSQALLLDDGAALGTRWEAFLAKYFIQADYQGHSWNLRPGATEAISERLRGLVYRADDSAYLAALPGILDEFIPVPLAQDAQAVYDEMQKDSVVGELKVVAKNKAVQAGKLAQIASGGLYRGEEKDLVWVDMDRIKAVWEYVRGLREPVIITYQYTFQLDVLREAFPDAPVLGVGGDCSAEHLVAFNTGEIPVLLGHPKSFGMGLNLQGACRTMIHYSPIYSGDRYRQVIGRIHRRGQTQQVRRVSFFAPGTVEEKTMAALARKERDEAAFMLHL
jgi:superfamily II DNA or RNA helicase